MEENEYTLEARVESIYFENPQNFFKIMRVRILETDSSLVGETVVTGSFGEISVGQEYVFVGNVVTHQKYGLQFRATSSTEIKPSTENGLIHYLSSSKFEGIGKKTAKQIVDQLGMNAIDKILEDESVLNGIKLTKKRKASLVEALRLNYGMEKIMVNLTNYGFGAQLSLAIFNKYKENTLDIIQENPYQLVEEIQGIGFAKADHLAESLGYTATSSPRIQAGILHVLLEYCMKNGHTNIDVQDLLIESQKLLEASRREEIPPQLIADEIIRLVDEEKIQQEGMQIFEKSLYYAEQGIANKVELLLKKPPIFTKKKADLEEKLLEVEEELEISYAKVQKDAIVEAFQHRFFLLTGGPGTGKTTIINGIVHLYSKIAKISMHLDDYAHDQFPILLAAPTGRAAKRMNETTHLPSGTIHRMLGLTKDDEERSEEVKELMGGLLIVDEFSMVDTWLANLLFKAISMDMHVIFVGDKDQLPSVGPGQVLHDLLQIKEIPKWELTEIFRQKGSSSIIPLAHEIKDGKIPQNLTKKYEDRSFIPTGTANVPDYVTQIVKKAMEKGYTSNELHVLAPMYKGQAGINHLNTLLQETFNPNENNRKREVKYQDEIFRVGDKVLQTVNDSELKVFNGDFGRIVGISFSKETEKKQDVLHIDFDGIEVDYPRNDWGKITLSYATSIHKAQGSEFQMVLLPFVMSYRIMLQRNLLYTAITRAKEKLILLGEPLAFQIAAESEGAIRKTYLKERFVELGYTLEDGKRKNERTIEVQKIEREEPLRLQDETFDEFDTFYDVQENAEQKRSDESSVNVSTQQFENSSMQEEEIQLTDDKILHSSIDPMIGMKDLSPFDFLES